jgi:hypothetical protein
MTRTKTILFSIAVVALGAPLAVAIAADAGKTSLAVPAQKYPDVVAAKARASGVDTFDFDVTVSSPYDTPKRYADAFRVVGRDGTVFGERTLWHDHADEQPFTRDLHRVVVPRAVRFVTIEARDKQYGYGGGEGGKAFDLALPGR